MRISFAITITVLFALPITTRVEQRACFSFFMMDDGGAFVSCPFLFPFFFWIDGWIPVVREETQYENLGSGTGTAIRWHGTEYGTTQP